MKYAPYSYSKIQTYKKCPAKFKYSYIDKLKIPRPESPAMSRGSSIHKSIERFMKRESEQLDPEIAEAYTQYFFSLRENYPCYPEAPFALKGGNIFYDPKEWVKAEFQPCTWEDPEVVFRGFYDLKIVTEVGVVIDEFKTGKEYPEHAIQRVTYAMVALIEHPEFPSVDTRTLYLDGVKVRNQAYPRHMLVEYAGQLRRDILQPEMDTLFSPMPSYGCRYCEFSRQNNGPCQF